MQKSAAEEECNERRHHDDDNTSNKQEQLEEDDDEEKSQPPPPPLMALNHVSRLCRSVQTSMEFYEKVLGFVAVERPQALDDSDGAWLFNYGVGIHLLQANNDSSEEEDGRLPRDTQRLDPKDNHISFQCEDMEEMERKLKEHGIKYIKRTVGGGGNDHDEDDKTVIDQLFFNDPDGFMIEICNCENVKLVPAPAEGAASANRMSNHIKLPSGRHNPPVLLQSNT